jgi:hypothetical protein
MQYLKENPKCSYCDADGEELHEEWRFDVAKTQATQVLLDVRILCKKCHLATHILRSSAALSEREYQEIIEHIMHVNGWSATRIDKEIKDALDCYYWLKNQLKGVTTWKLDYALLIPKIAIARTFVSAIRKCMRHNPPRKVVWPKKKK